MSFLSFGKVYSTEITKVSQTECYSSFLKKELQSYKVTISPLNLYTLSTLLTDTALS